MVNHQLVHIAEPSVLLLLTDTLDIVRAQHVPRSYRAQEFVIRLRSMVAATCGAPRIDGDQYHADGLGVWRLLLWKMERRPNASPAATLDAFDRLFDGNPRDALKASLRIYTGTTAGGEAGYFVQDQRNRHPREMGAIAIIGAMHRSGQITG